MAVVCKKVVRLCLPKFCYDLVEALIVCLNFFSDVLCIGCYGRVIKACVKRWNILSRNVPVLHRIAKQHPILTDGVGSLKVVFPTRTIADSNMTNKGNYPCKKRNGRPNDTEGVMLVSRIDHGRKVSNWQVFFLHPGRFAR